MGKSEGVMERPDRLFVPYWSSVCFKLGMQSQSIRIFVLFLSVNP